MRKIGKLNLIRIGVIIFLSLSFTLSLFAENEIIDFESEKWQLRPGAKIETYLGKKALIGGATLKDVTFKNGIIEYDIVFEGERTFAGLFFRFKDRGNYEYFYMRPHASGKYNALQYTPHINGVTGWQLYAQRGYTAAADIPHKKWIHVKIEIFNKQARIYIDGSKKPDLVVEDLKHGISEGAIVLNAPANSLSRFANFKFKKTDKLGFNPPPKVHYPDSLIKNWEISPVYKVDKINLLKTPEKQNLKSFKWTKVESEESGLVNFSRWVKKQGRPGLSSADIIYARTIIDSDKKQMSELTFGYSDAATIFLNGKPIFNGVSSYRQRDPLFAGLLGLYDSLYLDLKKGKNELIFLVAETFGGWGIKAKLDEARGNPVYESEKITRLWDKPGFQIPESALYDRKRDVLYITNYYNLAAPRQKKEFISKVKLNGEVEKLQWATGLDRPTGMAMYDDSLYVVIRSGVVVINPDTGKIIKKIKGPNDHVKDEHFFNDIVFSEKGIGYVSVGIKDAIFSLKDGKLEAWLKHPEVGGPNGLMYNNGKLLFGNSEDNCIKKIDVKTKKIENLICFEAGIMDGLKGTEDGGYIITNWEGRTYLMDKDGKVTLILDTSAVNVKSADIEYIPGKRMIIIPTFYGNRVIAYKLNN